MFLVFIKLIFITNSWTVIQRLVFILYINLYEHNEMETRSRLWKSAFQFLKPPI